MVLDNTTWVRLLVLYTIGLFCYEHRTSSTLIGQDVHFPHFNIGILVLGIRISDNTCANRTMVFLKKKVDAKARFYTDLQY